MTKTALTQSTPEAQGFASASILTFIDAVEQAELELNSLILVRHGYVIAKGWWSPYAADIPHMLFSLSKSFTSTAVGMAVAEGRLTVNDRVVDFFPDDLPDSIGDNLAVMNVHNLLSMNTGHDKDATEAFRTDQTGNWVKAVLARPVEHLPGTRFVYNSAATYLLSAIVQKLTGQTLLEYLTPRLFEPLGIEGATWQSCPRGINLGGWGLSIKSDDIANFGQLYLQQGRWPGQQLITPEWVAAATSKQVRNDLNVTTTNPDWLQGYGYQFWRCRHGAYRGDGAYGQFCIVMPDQDAVVAITSSVRNMQTVLDLVWDHLLPAMQSTPLPADVSAQEALAKRLAGLALRPQSGVQSSYLAARVSGKHYAFEENEGGITRIKFDFGPEGDFVTFHDKQGEHRIALGYQSWIAGKTRFEQDKDEPDELSIAASGAWLEDDTYAIRLAYTETPFIPTYTFRFVDDRLEFRRTQNVGFGLVEGQENPTLVGKSR